MEYVPVRVSPAKVVTCPATDVCFRDPSPLRVFMIYLHQGSIPKLLCCRRYAGDWPRARRFAKLASIGIKSLIRRTLYLELGGRQTMSMVGQSVRANLTVKRKY